MQQMEQVTAVVLAMELTQWKVKSGNQHKKFTRVQPMEFAMSGEDLALGTW